MAVPLFEAKSQGRSILERLESAVGKDINQELREKMHEALFKVADGDGSGMISKQELGVLLRKVNPALSSKQLAKALDEINTNGDGGIDFDEFMEHAVAQQHSGQEHQLDVVKATFRTWDKDRNGKLSKKEFFNVMRALMPGMTDSKIQILYGAVDLNDDGFISYDEWVNYMFHSKTE
eukprot:TRINITY_DN76737_c0_g1_i1.p1 TRINITY_DN76737_c0_g1~~TRINITY_DN76737_c0_g1_i1.p1  ORF type:complete len:199 (+),score=42.04 TRINITY_DN76737_c0_g1_i1:65-598(+)